MYEGDKFSERRHDSICDRLGRTVFRTPHGGGGFETEWRYYLIFSAIEQDISRGDEEMA
jgi:hypothetical protein